MGRDLPPPPRFRLIPGAPCPRPPAPPPVAPEPSQQIQRSMAGVPLPTPTGVQTFTEQHKQHDWNVTKNTPDWLNSLDSEGKVCRVCGVAEMTGRVIRADRAGMDYIYKDAWGNTIQSMEPLPCPVFLGDLGGAIMDGRVKIRGLTGRVGGVENRVESIEERLDRLEEENATLREQVAQATVEIDATAVIQWLAEMVRQHAAADQPTVPALIGGKPLALPEPVADLVTALGVRAHGHREPVPARKKPSNE